MNRFSFIKFAILTAVFFFAFQGASAQKSKSKKAGEPVQTAMQQNETLSSEMETALLKEVNAIRSNPLQYVAYLEEYKKSAKGNSFLLPDGVRLTTNEDAKTLIDDAIAELKKMAKASDLGFSSGLIKACKNHQADLKSNYALGHYGKDGSGLEQRLSRFGRAGINVAENLSFGAATPREILMSWILDDGIKSRSHRKNIFSPKFSVFGVSCGESSSKEVICVAVFANSFTESKTPSGVKQIF